MKYIIYHDKCTDGFGAAWVAWSFFKEDAVYIPLNHYDPIPEFLPNSEIFLLDFCFPQKKLIELAQNHQVTVLDHHVSAYKEVSDLINNPIENLKLFFNLNQSGAEMAWNFWYPDKTLPDLIHHIRDRDLGLYQLPRTHKIISALMTIPKDFITWSSLNLDELYLRGEIIFQVQDQLMKEMVEKHHWAEIAGQVVPVVNATVWWSDITQLLLDRYPEAPFAAAYYSLDGNRTKWSLRSREGSSVNVAELSEKYNGGGHCHSGGFTTSNGDIVLHSHNYNLKKIA